jgi:hypothetical protein
MKYTIKKANAVYTGGGIFIFWGDLEDNKYFMCDDDGGVIILDSDPTDFDVSLYVEWQEEHLVEYLEDNEEERLLFCDSLCDYLMKATKSERGGLSDFEIEHYRKWFKLL